MTKTDGIFPLIGYFCKMVIRPNLLVPNEDSIQSFCDLNNLELQKIWAYSRIFSLPHIYQKN